MVSQLAMEDIKDITSKGGQVSPEDVILLNALALKITNSGDSELATLPRFAYLCDVVFKEPTIKQDIFLQDASRVFSGDDATYIAVQAWVLGHDNDELKDELLRHPMLFSMKVKRWLKKHMKDTTMNQIARVVFYCRYGCDPETNEFPTYLIEEYEKSEDRLGDDYSWALRQYLTSASVGIENEVALRATSPQLSAMIERAYVVRQVPMSTDEKKTTGDYYRTLESIKKKAFNKQEVQDGRSEDKD